MQFKKGTEGLKSNPQVEVKEKNLFDFFLKPQEFVNVIILTPTVNDIIWGYTHTYFTKNNQNSNIRPEVLCLDQDSEHDSYKCPICKQKLVGNKNIKRAKNAYLQVIDTRETKDRQDRIWTDAKKRWKLSFKFAQYIIELAQRSYNGKLGYMLATVTRSTTLSPSSGDQIQFLNVLPVSKFAAGRRAKLMFALEQKNGGKRSIIDLAKEHYSPINLEKLLIPTQEKINLFLMQVAHLEGREYNSPSEAKFAGREVSMPESFMGADTWASASDASSIDAPSEDVWGNVPSVDAPTPEPEPAFTSEWVDEPAPVPAPGNRPPVTIQESYKAKKVVSPMQSTNPPAQNYGQNFGTINQSVPPTPPVEQAVPFQKKARGKKPKKEETTPEQPIEFMQNPEDFAEYSQE